MEFFLPGSMTVIGVFFLFRNISMIRNESKLESYLHNSSKGKLWVKKFGIEKTKKLTQKYFLPIGSLISVLLMFFGVWNLVLLLG